MQLSKHFALAEFVESQTAARKGIDNTPPSHIIDNLRMLATGLENVRILLGNRPIRISSGYRCPALNTAVGGARSSHHMQGFAADFTCPAYGRPMAICEAIAASSIRFDQLILEFDAWVHLSVAPSTRRQVLTVRKLGRRAVTMPGLVAK